MCSKVKALWMFQGWPVLLLGKLANCAALLSLVSSEVIGLVQAPWPCRRFPCSAVGLVERLADNNMTMQSARILSDLQEITEVSHHKICASSG